MADRWIAALQFSLEGCLSVYSRRSRQKTRKHRPLCLEQLESRTLMSGVTLITHGLETSSGTPQWIADMGTAIAAHAAGGGPVSVYTLTVTGSLFGVSITHSTLTGANPLTSNNGEIILLLDWSQVATVANYTPTGTVAQAVAGALENPNFISDMGGVPLAALPIQLIGHSRGASLVAALAGDLGQAGIWVDQLTTLDPHPGPLDASMDVTSNVRFADNYWRGSSSDVIVPNGTAVTGAHNVHLDDSVVDYGGYYDGHNNTHLWYQGTIDQSSNASQEGHAVVDSWFTGVNGPRNANGFYWSRLGGGDRTNGASDGLASAGASRVAVSVSASGANVWDNIEITNGMTNQTVAAGASINVATSFQDANQDATITFGFDTDNNPFDGTAGVQQQFAGGAPSGSGTFALSTAGLAAGTYYTYAEISNGTHTRYYYTTGAVTVTVAPVPHATEYVTQLYHDLLHRDPDPTGLANWVNALNTGATRADVAMAITSSREYDGNVVDSFYVQYLGRHAETAGLNAWVDQMQAGLNAEVIRAGILGSDEYFHDVGGTNSAYLNALYQTFLNRAPDPTGITYWTGMLTDGKHTRQDVASGISNSDETRTDIITSYYENFLQRAPDAAGIAAWKQNLANGMSEPAIITQFVTSPEYLALHGLA
jgi:hypothetical protein